MKITIIINVKVNWWNWRVIKTNLRPKWWVIIDRLRLGWYYCYDVIGIRTRLTNKKFWCKNLLQYYFY